MEYALNWMVLLLSLGGIVLVALVCCADLKKGGARPVETASPVVDMPQQPQIEQQAASGPFVELVYKRGDEVEYVQKIYEGQKGYIGTESYPGLGAGMPVRYLEVIARGGEFLVSNLDWQMPVHLSGETGDTELVIGQEMPVSDGCELHLSGGWIVECRINEETQV